MASNSIPPLPSITASSLPNSQSDFGSEFDLSALLEQEARKAAANGAVGAQSDYGSDLDPDEVQLIAGILDQLEDIGTKSLVLENLEDEALPTVARVPKHSSRGSTQTSTSTQYFSITEESCLQHTGSQGAFSGGSQTEGRSHHSLARDADEPIQPESLPLNTPAEDDILPDPQAADPKVEGRERTPLQKFRSRRPLAVSDIVGPAWCELQYYHSLNKYGQMKRTKAMKEGSTVHKKLELEVHEFVPINVKTKEDGWGLRLWNVIQGLRTLRATGMTREVDVWGVIDGQVISGIIDELSYVCPDPDLEYALEESAGMAVDDSGIFLESGQRTIEEYFSSQSPPAPCLPERSRRLYITDTKTRTSKTLPARSSLRPTEMQLMLYHHLISLLCTDQVSSEIVFGKYQLDGQAPFSKIFLDEIASLEFNFDPAVSVSPESSGDVPATQFSTSVSTFAELQRHPNLDGLWNLMIKEYQRSVSPGTLSPILNASYRYQKNGTILGAKTFVYDDEILQSYVTDELDFWRGTRAPRGVDIEDAYKCRLCEFAENCEWRIEKHQEAMDKISARRGKAAKTAPLGPG